MWVKLTFRIDKLFPSADIWGDGDDDDEDDEDDEEKNENGEPDWVASEREQFRQFRDKNQDGKLDADEIKEWIIPEDYDHSSAEAKHLIASSDVDKVCCLWCVKTAVSVIWKRPQSVVENFLFFFGSDKLPWFLSLFCPEFVDMICSQICELSVHSYFWTTPECNWTSI